MKILVGCEFSGVVCRAFAKLGHDAWSCDLLPAEDGSNKHLRGDIRNYLDMGWDFLAVMHPPCFANDTMVLTTQGYKPISKVEVGDQVLTHKGRWRCVTEVMRKTTRSTVKFKSSNSLSTVTTPEHPYYVRYRMPYANGFRTKAERDGAPTFVEASKLTNQHFTGSVLPPVTPSSYDDETLWLMGRYVADGHLRDSRWTEEKFEEMVLSIGPEKLDAFKARVTWKHTISPHEAVYRATFYGHDRIEVFYQFGRGAENKNLPVWVLQLPKSQARVFLDGYLSGDGYTRDKTVSATTTSKSLALGIAVLMQRVYGKCPALRTQQPRREVRIEGRLVDTLPLHTVEVPQSTERLRNYVDGDYAWGHVRKATVTHDKKVTVFNLSVEEDETYTANGVVVHNCTRLCNSGVRWLSEPPGKLTAEHYTKAEIEAYREMNREERLAFMWAKLDEGAALFSDCWNAPIERIAVENPVMHHHAKSRIRNYQEPSQTVQPWWFGEPFFKGTSFFTKRLPTLKPTNKLTPPKAGTPEHRKWSAVHMASPGPDRWKIRSRFLDGMANAMALQWGGDADDEERIAA